jgi:hypothetical protein
MKRLNGRDGRGKTHHVAEPDVLAVNVADGDTGVAVG